MCIEIRKTFEFEVKKLSLHPSGLYLLAATDTKVLFVHILISNLKIYKEINFSKARIMHFSNGGQFFALSNDKNIQILDFYQESNVPVFVFEGHEKQGRLLLLICKYRTI